MNVSCQNTAVTVKSGMVYEKVFHPVRGVAKEYEMIATRPLQRAKAHVIDAIPKLVIRHWDVIVG